MEHCVECISGMFGATALSVLFPVGMFAVLALSLARADERRRQSLADDLRNDAMLDDTLLPTTLETARLEVANLRLKLHAAAVRERDASELAQQQSGLLAAFERQILDELAATAPDDDVAPAAAAIPAAAACAATEPLVELAAVAALADVGVGPSGGDLLIFDDLVNDLTDLTDDRDDAAAPSTPHATARALDSDDEPARHHRHPTAATARGAPPRARFGPAARTSAAGAAA